MERLDMNCDGNCDELTSEGCRGNIRLVFVFSTSESPDPFLKQKHRFYYCDTAISMDRKNGYRVELA